MKFLIERGRARGEYYEEETKTDCFSVTQVRTAALDVYAGIPEAQLEAARIRGKALHAWFWRYLASLDGLVESPPRISQYEGYCVAIEHWAHAVKPIPVRLEESSWHEDLGYAGTPDALVMMDPKETLTLVDLKTGGPSATDAMQLIAYHKMTGYTAAKRTLDLYISEDGSYRMVEPTREQRLVDWAAFCNALTLLKWRAKQ